MLSEKIKFLIITFSLILVISCKASDNPLSQDSTSGKTIVGQFGLLQAKGDKIVDKNKNPIALHGMSLFWSQWSGSFYNSDCIDWLYSDWKCTVIRPAMGIEGGGYLSNPEAELAKVITVTDACIKNGIYVVIDWHDHNAQNHLEQAKKFFEIISEKYGNYPNVIYEIYNEPLQVSWKDIVKPYAEEVIKVIRANDPDNLIIVGNPTWSQDVDIAALDPIKDVNVAYALHFYTSTHKQPLRDKSIKAMNSNAALFISEFGISEANGAGIIDYEETQRWIDFFKQYKLSTCNWSAFDKNETSAALKPGANPHGGWKDSDLTESGKFNRDLIRTLNADLFKTIGVEY